MTRYQLLKKNENLIFSFVKNGILSYQILRDLEIYEKYQELGDEINNNQFKYLLLSEEHSLSEKSIERIIYQMNRIIK